MGDNDDMEQKLKKVEHDLIERSKELKTLYAVIDTAEIPGLEFDEIISALKTAIPSGFQYPDNTCIRIVLNGNEYMSENFKKTAWILSEPIILHGLRSGHLDIFYTEKYPDEDEGPFLKEERTLLNAIAKRVSRMIERLHIDKILQVKNLSFNTSISANTILGLIGTIIEPNQAAVELWGYIDLNEVIDKHISDFFADPNKALAVFSTLQESGKWEGDFFAKRKDGSIFTAYALANSIVDRNGNVICYQASVIDISEQRKLQDKLAHQLEFETLLSKISTRLISIPVEQLDNEIRNALSNICKYLDIDLSSIYEPESPTGKSLKLTFVYTSEKIPPVSENFTAVRYFPWCEQQLLLGNQVVVSSMDKLPEEATVDKQSWKYYGIKSSVIFPLLSKGGKLHGTISFDMLREERNWDNALINQLQFVAQIIVNALIRKQSEESLKNSNEKLAQRLEQSIKAISKIGELRDMYTAGHQKRVQELACAIALEMGMPNEMIKNISQGALIHDIGKIYVASEILNKPGKLTDLEFQMIKTHVIHGYEIVKEIDFPEQTLTMIHQHHERLDGSGYPNGVSGDEIIIESRILAVADVVEAMSSHRPYRPALGIEPALAELRAGKGVKYDAKVVDICIRLFTEKEFKFSS